MKSDIRIQNSEFRILNDCRKLFFKVLDITKNNPQFKYTLNQHILRSVVSIGSNIAEGNIRKGNDFNRFLNIASGSLAETKFQLSLYNLNKHILDDVFDLLDKIGAVIYKLRKSEFRSRRAE